MERGNAPTSFASVKTLRDISDRTHRAKACCRNNWDLIENLLRSDAMELDANWLRSELGALQGYIDSSEGFLDRIRNTQEQVGYTLNLHNQLEIRDLNVKLNSLLEQSATVDIEIRDLSRNLNGVIEKLKDLTETSVDDSATVRILSVVSAIYLPGSFVAVSETQCF